VSFAIGNKFFDEVGCDVFDMDISHLILGDHGSMIDMQCMMAQAHIYCHEKWAKVCVESSKYERSICVKWWGIIWSYHSCILQAFLHEAQGEDVYLLLVAEQRDGITVPKEAQGLLREFSDVFPQELPSILPPMRDI
jgi:hypothetical protein